MRAGSPTTSHTAAGGASTTSLTTTSGAFSGTAGLLFVAGGTRRYHLG